jgi:hypothetical protein
MKSHASRPASSLLSALLILFLSLSLGGCLLWYEAPSLAIPDQSATVGATMTLHLGDFTEYKGSGSLEYGFVSPEEYSYIGSIAGDTYTLTPLTGQEGTHTISVFCTNGLKDSTDDFVVTVTANTP